MSDVPEGLDYQAIDLPIGRIGLGFQLDSLPFGREVFPGLPAQSVGFRPRHDPAETKHTPLSATPERRLFFRVNQHSTARLTVEVEVVLYPSIDPERESLTGLGIEGDLASARPIGPYRLAHDATLSNRKPTTTGESPTVVADSHEAG
jgi:hypothetical protein